MVEHVQITNRQIPTFCPTLAANQAVALTVVGQKGISSMPTFTGDSDVDQSSSTLGRGWGLLVHTGHAMRLHDLRLIG